MHTAPVVAQSVSATQDALRLAGEAVTAAEANDHAAAVKILTEAVTLRPDLPRVIESLAVAQVAAGEPDAAIATLQRLAALGVGAAIDKSGEFASLRSHRGFSDAVRKLADNLRPKGSGEIAFTLRDVTGLIEGIAWRAKTREFYFGDVNGRAIWVRTADGGLRRLTPAGDELLGVFGLAIDEDSGAVWAATSAVPEMQGFAADQEGLAVLVEIDLENGAVRQSIPISGSGPGAHVLGDLARSADGSIWLTDSREPVLWKYVPGARSLERAIASTEFMALKGIVILGDDVAVVTDQMNGLMRVDLRGRQVLRMGFPPDTTLIGIDGLTVAPDGTLLALQSGFRPSRVLRIELDAAWENIQKITVLESGHLTMSAPSLGCIGAAGDFYFIGNPGWNRFQNSDGKPSAPRPVPVFRTKLGKGK